MATINNVLLVGVDVYGNTEYLECRETPKYYIYGIIRVPKNTMKYQNIKYHIATIDDINNYQKIKHLELITKCKKEVSTLVSDLEKLTNLVNLNFIDNNSVLESINDTIDYIKDLFDETDTNQLINVNTKTNTCLTIDQMAICARALQGIINTFDLTTDSKVRMSDSLDGISDFPIWFKDNISYNYFDEITEAVKLLKYNNID